MFRFWRLEVVEAYWVSWVVVVDECGGFVWDYFCGEVVCVDSGEVVDRIYDYGPVYRGSDERDWVRRVDPGRLREFWRLRRRLRRRQVFLRRARFFVERGYEVDYDRLLSNEKFVFTVYSERTVKVLEWFEERGLKPVLDKIIDILKDVEPVALSRTIRGRYLLAYIIYEILSGKDPVYSELGDLKTLVGGNTFGRLKKLAYSIVARHRSLLEEVVGDE